MKNFIFRACLLTLLPLQIFSQIADRATPSFYAKKDIPVIVLPDINVRELEKQDRKYEKTGLKSMRFAKVIEVDIWPDEDGLWDLGFQNEKVWYIKIKSPGAYSLSILFDRYRLPVGAKLFVYSEDQKHIRGSFTYKNNKWNSMLPIAPVKGDEIVIEYHEPVNAEFKGELHIASVAHDYKNVFNYLDKSTKGFGDSGDCNVNINCDNDEVWQQLKHAVCKITYNGWLCSGTLINNTCQNGYPYFLTANHCINNPIDANAAIFYFNYESETCENFEGRKDQTVAGSKIIATPPKETLDFTLLQLNENPPPGYEPYFAGWSRDIIDPESVTSIHHPRGDIKKITKSYDGASTGNFVDPILDFYDYTHWWIDAWDEGTTEGGSSGSPLFNQNGQIIGDLTGGQADCDFNYNDYFQKFNHSWNTFNESNYQLQNWLDPLHSNAISLNGFQPYDTLPSNLNARLIDTVVILSWNHIIDTSSIDFYYVYRNSLKIDSVKNDSYTDTTAFKSILYHYYITAKYRTPLDSESVQSNIVYIQIMDALTVPFIETFEDGYIPDSWYELRSNDTVGWQFIEGGYEGAMDTAFEGTGNAYFYNDNGESSKLVLPKFDFSLLTNVKLTFYMNMKQFNNDVHELRVLYKNSDTIPWQVLRSYKSSVEKWEEKEIALPNLSDNYQIALEGIGLRGYGICIDSLSIVEDGKHIEPTYQVNKEEICIYDSVEFSTGLDESYSISWEFGSDAIPTNAAGVGPHWIKYLSTGIKGVQMVVNNAYMRQDVEAVTVYDSPINANFIIAGNELISNAEYGNQWYLNGSPISGATNKSYFIKEDGEYYLEVTNSYNCMAVSESKHLVLNDIIEIEDYNSSETNAIVFPNPNNGTFKINLDKFKNDHKLLIEIVDITGKISQTENLDSWENDPEVVVKNTQQGIYFIRIISDKNSVTSKILIKK